MDDRSLACPDSGARSPNPVVDDRYAALLADDLGVKATTARTAFIGEPVARALDVRAWALKHAPDDPDRRAAMILAWAKKRRAGTFREEPDAAGADAELELARKIAEYWRKNPERLADTLRAAHEPDGRQSKWGAA